MLPFLLMILCVAVAAEDVTLEALQDEGRRAVAEGYTVESPDDLEHCSAPPSEPSVDPEPRKMGRPPQFNLFAARAAQDRIVGLSRDELERRRELLLAREAHMTALIEARDNVLDRVPNFWHHVLEASHRRELLLMPLEQQELAASTFGSSSAVFRAVAMDDEEIVERHLSHLRCRHISLDGVPHYNLSIGFNEFSGNRRFPLRTTTWHRVLAAEIPHRISNIHTDWDEPAHANHQSEQQAALARMRWKAEFGEGTSLTFADEFLAESGAPLSGVSDDLRLGPKQAKYALPVPGSLISLFCGPATLSRFTEEQQGVTRARYYSFVAEVCGPIRAMPIDMYDTFMQERDHASAWHEGDLAAAQAIADLAATY